MTINTKVAKILSAGKILTAGLLGMNNTEIGRAHV